MALQLVKTTRAGARAGAGAGVERPAKMRGPTSSPILCECGSIEIMSVTVGARLLAANDCDGGESILVGGLLQWICAACHRHGRRTVLA